MKANLTVMGQLEITGEISNGLSHFSLPPIRVAGNYWKLDVVYVYKPVIPKYLKDRTEGIIFEVKKMIENYYGQKFALNGELGDFVVMYDEEENTGSFIFFVKDHPHNWKTGNELRKTLEIALRRIKKPYYTAWKESVKVRRLTASVSYVKASQESTDL